MGARRSNVGNAYQVTTGGTSTSPPTGTGTGINNGGAAVWKYLSAVDFTTLQAHANGLASTPGQPVVALLWFSGGVVIAVSGTSILTLSGHTTSPTNTITYKCAPGESFKDVFVAAPTTPYAYSTSNGVCFQLPSSGSSPINYFNINDSNVIFDGIQFKNPVGTNSGGIFGGSGASVTVQNCILDGFAQASQATAINISGAGLLVANSLFVTRNTTASSAVVSTSGGTNTVVANNTFVHATLITGQHALDSGSNTTNGNCHSTNNIFFNYGSPYQSASGTPWLSTTCAFSAASFAGNAGTDAGGSVFGITGAATFVTFLTDLNPAFGASVLDVGTTDTTDIPAAIDAFGNSRPQGSAWDIGAVERLVGTTVTSDFIAALEILHGQNNRDIVLPVAFNLTVKRDTFKSIDWRATIVGNTAFRAEVLMQMPGLPNPWSQDFSSDFGIGPYSLDPIVPIEWRQGAPSATSDSLIAIEWGVSHSGSPIVGSGDSVFSLEIKATIPHLPNPFSQEFSGEFGLGPYTIDPIFPIEWSHSNFVGNVQVPIAFSASYRADHSVSLESNLSVRRDIQSTIEWRLSVSGIVSTSICAIEWRSPVVTDVLISSDRQTFVASSFGAPFDWRSSFQRDSVDHVEWRASLFRDMVLPVASTANVIQSWTSAVCWNMSLSAESKIPVNILSNMTSDIIVPVTWNINPLSASVIAPVEWNSSAAGGSVNPLPVEWKSTKRSDGIVEIETRMSFQREFILAVETPASARSTSAVSLEIMATATTAVSMPVEFGHGTISRAVDLIAALEFGAIVHRDSVLGIEYFKIRKDVGAKLEPDHWERDHEP